MIVATSYCVPGATVVACVVVPTRSLLLACVSGIVAARLRSAPALQRVCHAGAARTTGGGPGEVGGGSEDGRRDDGRAEASRPVAPRGRTDARGAFGVVRDAFCVVCVARREASLEGERRVHGEILATHNAERITHHAPASRLVAHGVMRVQRREELRARRADAH